MPAQTPAPAAAPRAQPSGKAAKAANAMAAAQTAAKPSKQAAAAPVDVQKFPSDRKTKLFDWLASDSCGEKGQEEVADFLLSLGVQLPQDANGEMELDPDSLDAPTLWKLDKFCQEQSRGQYTPDVRSVQPRGPVLARHQYEDDETEED